MTDAEKKMRELLLEAAKLSIKCNLSRAQFLELIPHIYPPGGPVHDALVI